jgi:flagellar protein FlaI
MMVSGAVASGKTALLNSISMFIKPEMKVVTIEEVRELRLHENWIPMTTGRATRQDPGDQLFDLLRSALRQRLSAMASPGRGLHALQSIAVGGRLYSVADSEDSSSVVGGDGHPDDAASDELPDTDTQGVPTANVRRVVQ